MKRPTPKRTRAQAQRDLVNVINEALGYYSDMPKHARRYAHMSGWSGVLVEGYVPALDRLTKLISSALREPLKEQ